MRLFRKLMIVLFNSHDFIVEHGIYRGLDAMLLTKCHHRSREERHLAGAFGFDILSHGRLSGIAQGIHHAQPVGDIRFIQNYPFCLATGMTPAMAPIIKSRALPDFLTLPKFWPHTETT